VRRAVVQIFAFVDSRQRFAPASRIERVVPECLRQAEAAQQILSFTQNRITQSTASSHHLVQEDPQS
jgi:hypothetical protein